MSTDQSTKIAVYGLWHLGCVTSAMLASEGFEVCGLDDDSQLIENLQAGQLPLYEPGLTELIGQGLASNRLSFTTDPVRALTGSKVLWITFDTPVDDQDRADVAYVNSRLDGLFEYIQPGTLIIISSQVPVGFSAALQKRWQSRDLEKSLTYCYSPENLRLGQALKSFRAEDRIVVGVEAGTDRALLVEIFSRFSPRLEWMSISSAEMTKHALNSFLAVSVAFINELARLCEQIAADAKEVERGLKSEIRIGPRAYLGPGSPFAGGTLARDLRFLTALGRAYNLPTPLLDGTFASNELHKGWVQQAIIGLLPEAVSPARVTILGLTYKPGTDTLRRSESVQLGLWLVGQGIQVTFHDPVTKELPEELATRFQVTQDLEAAVKGADILVVATGWPLYREQITPDWLTGIMRQPVVIDQNRYLAAQLEAARAITYVAVGKPVRS